MNHHLNSKQLARYHSLGYLDCGRVMSDAAVTELRDIADRFAAEAQAGSIGLSTEPDQSYTLFTPVFTRTARYKELVLQHAVIPILSSLSWDRYFDWWRISCFTNLPGTAAHWRFIRTMATTAMTSRKL